MIEDTIFLRGAFTRSERDVSRRSSVRGNGRRPDTKSEWIAVAFDLFDAWDVRPASWFNAGAETGWQVFAAAGTGDGAPEPRTIDGRSYAAYPAFRHAALRYVDG